MANHLGGDPAEDSAPAAPRSAPSFGVADAVGQFNAFLAMIPHDDCERRLRDGIDLRYPRLGVAEWLYRASLSPFLTAALIPLGRGIHGGLGSSDLAVETAGAIRVI